MTKTRPAPHQPNHSPTIHQAYSDRTAWLMACLSQLAYQPFGGPGADDTQILLQKELRDLLDEQVSEAEDCRVIPTPESAPIVPESAPASKPANHNFSIEQTYDVGGTQALLISAGDFIALAFRGTEAASFEDIKSYANAALKPCPSGGNVHSGFSDAFDLVSAEIQTDLGRKAFADRPLFITGHSLGAALATIAAKRLTHSGGIAACYSFGSPKVGDEDWSLDIKPPIYRVVNAIDSVTMLPPNDGVIGAMKDFVGLVPFIGERLQKILQQYEGYFHVGEMRYLTNCRPNQYDDVEVTNGAGFMKRLRIFLRGKKVRKLFKDHSISIYRMKLAIIARRHARMG